jgi:hypothetical protein
MWAMNGLEAIYTEDRQDITEQMVQNTQQILGLNTDLNDPVRKMYKYRSEYAHGSMNMYPIYFEPDLTIKAVNAYYRETENHMGLAIEMLLMSLQTMVVKDVTKFKFKPLTSARTRHNILQRVWNLLWSFICQDKPTK